MEHTLQKIQIKNMIWWFITNFSVKQTESVSGQHVTTFALSCNQRLNLAQSLKIKIQWCCYSIKNHWDHQKHKEKLIGFPPNKRFLLCLWARHEIVKDAHIGIQIEAKESIKKKIWNTFKPDPLPMPRNLINK